VTVARLSIDGADFWVQSDPASSPDSINGMSVRMILTVDDPDAVFARAVGAGATDIVPVSEDHGWRVGRVADPGGHHWEMANGCCELHGLHPDGARAGSRHDRRGHTRPGAREPLARAR
jgi:hypothetical protein